MTIRIWSGQLLTGLLFFCSLLNYAQPKRIISLGGAITETVADLGFEKQIIAVDVTSEYPESIKKLPKVSKNRSVSAEGLIAQRPDLIIAPEGDVPYGVIQSLKGAGIKFVSIKQEYSVKGALQFIRDVAIALGEKEKGIKLASDTQLRINKVLQTVKSSKIKPKVLFIYARGTGSMTVAGKGSNMDAMITLAGGRNAIQEFNRYKTYSTESLIKANPDMLFLFDFGMESLGGSNGLLKMPGVSYTNAGKNKKIAAMNGPLMINFSTRLDQAIAELHKEFLKVK